MNRLLRLWVGIRTPRPVAACSDGPGRGSVSRRWEWPLTGVRSGARCRVVARPARRARAALWGFVLHLTGGDRNRAEDVVQETLFRAWRRPVVLAQQDSSARGWLFTVARNIVVDDWRAGQRRPTTSSELVPEPLEPDATDTARAVDDGGRRDPPTEPRPPNRVAGVLLPGLHGSAGCRSAGDPGRNGQIPAALRAACAPARFRRNGGGDVRANTAAAMPPTCSAPSPRRIGGISRITCGTARTAGNRFSDSPVCRVCWH